MKGTYPHFGILVYIYPFNSVTEKKKLGWDPTSKIALFKFITLLSSQHLPKSIINQILSLGPGTNNFHVYLVPM